MVFVMPGNGANGEEMLLGRWTGEFVLTDCSAGLTPGLGFAGNACSHPMQEVSREPAVLVTPCDEAHHLSLNTMSASVSSRMHRAASHTMNAMTAASAILVATSHTEQQRMCYASSNECGTACAN